MTLPDRPFAGHSTWSLSTWLLSALASREVEAFMRFWRHAAHFVKVNKFLSNKVSYSNLTRVLRFI